MTEPNIVFRERTKFLFFPMRIGNKVKWLKKATFVEEFRSCLYCRPGHPVYAWVPTQWVEDE